MKANNRARCSRINALLTATFGTPKWDGLQDPLDVLMETLLTQASTPTKAVKTFAALKKQFADWDAMATAKSETVSRVLNAGDIPKAKAKEMVDLVRDLKRERGSANLDFIKTMSVREAMRAFEAFEGVGPKTGACVLLFALGREICPVDTNIHRILQRVGIVSQSATPEATFETLQPLVPRGQSFVFHVNLIKLGRDTCKAGRPKCSECPIEIECRSTSKNLKR